MSTTVRDSRKYEKTRTQKLSSKCQLTAYLCEMKKKLVTYDEGMISDYEPEPEMSEEYVLKYLENELGNSTETLQTSLN